MGSQDNETIPQKIERLNQEIADRQAELLRIACLEIKTIWPYQSIGITPEWRRTLGNKV